MQLCGWFAELHRFDYMLIHLFVEGFVLGGMKFHSPLHKGSSRDQFRKEALVALVELRFHGSSVSVRENEADRLGLGLCGFVFSIYVAAKQLIGSRHATNGEPLAWSTIGEHFLEWFLSPEHI